MDNQLDKSKQKVSIQTYLRSGVVQERLQEMLKDKAQQFTISLISAVNANVLLQECAPQSIVMAAMKAAAMDLPIDPNLGLSYVIPYRNNKLGIYEAQFQMGWRGFVQLAQRSRQYKLINVTDVRKGEHQGENRMTGEIEFEWIDDEKERKQQPVIGYLAFFRLLSGFEKMLYMTVEELKAHAKKYSQSYRKGYGLWVDDFDSMSKKTTVKLLISRWGPMSTEMQQAILSDQAAVGEDSFQYIDNDKAPEPTQVPPKPHEETKTTEPIPEAETVPTPPKKATKPTAQSLIVETKDEPAPPADKNELEAIKESIRIAAEMLELTVDGLKKIYREVSSSDNLDSMSQEELELVYDYLMEIEKQEEAKTEEKTEAPADKQTSLEDVQSIFPGAESIPKQ